MKNQGSPSFNGLLSIKALWCNPQQAADVPIERTFSNESTIEKDGDITKERAPPPSPTSVTQCDIFRPLREALFCDEMEDMLTLRKARPVCCVSLLDLDEDEDEEEEDPEAPVPLTRQDALFATLDLLERDEEETVAGSVSRGVTSGKHQHATKRFNRR